MTREIKFRCKRVTDSTWIYGYYYCIGRDTNQKHYILPEYEVALYGREVIPETVEQFTGLKDINDKEIYEDDIICISDTYTDGILDDGSGPSCEFNHLAKAVFVDGAFGLEIFEDGDDFYRGFWSFISIKDRVGDLDIIVVGNIHDNPELLKEIK